MRTTTLIGTLATLGVLLAGCGNADEGASDTSSSSSHQHRQKHDHDGMSGMTMKDVDKADAPTETARMVCEEDEIRDAVKRAFAMKAQPTSTHRWSAKDRVYTCRWSVPHGTLLLTVQDATDAGSDRAWFDGLRGRLDGLRRIRGVESFGLPAYQTPAGDVLFLKDGKTLHVDATGLPQSSLPKGFGREEVAYSVASAVVACWTE